MKEFVVSARKYRPITFESVVGQSHITTTLRNAIGRGQLAHAYLFCGPRGVGKTTCARILAKSINCLSPGEDLSPCNECESCQAFNNSNSFNIHELDAASNNSVDNIRQLTDQVRIPPQIGKYSIYIIDEVHMLSQAAFNAFLKTLEEPPAHAIFILATTEKHKILPTILSRCQIYDFRRIKVEDIVQFLRYISSSEGVTSDDESYNLIAQKSEGCMRDALSMFDKVVSFSGGKLEFISTASSLNVLDYDTYFTFINNLYQGDFSSALTLFDDILQRGFDSTIFLSGITQHIRDLLVAKNPATLPLLEVSGTLLDRYSSESVKYDLNFIYKLLELLTDAESRLKGSLNQRLLVELTILKAANISGRVVEKSVQTNIIVPKVEVKKNEQPLEVVNVENIIKEPIKVDVTPVEQPVNVEKRQQAPTASPLGISIGAMISDNKLVNIQQKEEETVQKLSENNERKKIEIDEDLVLSACQTYANFLKSQRPRYVSIFENAQFIDGKILLTLPNQIVAEEMSQQKMDIISELISVTDLPYVDIAFEIDESKSSSEDLLFRDEDKIRFMVEKNNHVSELCASLGLDLA